MRGDKVKRITCPLCSEAKLGCLELENIQSDKEEKGKCDRRTIRLVYWPPGISWSKTLESDARTLASKQLYNIRT